MRLIAQVKIVMLAEAGCSQTLSMCGSARGVRWIALDEERAEYESALLCKHGLGIKPGIASCIQQ